LNLDLLTALRPQVIIFVLGWPNTQALRDMPEHRAMLVEIGLPGAAAAV
jgi:hypothetical protein